MSLLKMFNLTAAVCDDLVLDCIMGKGFLNNLSLNLSPPPPQNPPPSVVHMPLKVEQHMTMIECSFLY